MAERELIIKYRIDNESRTFAAQEKARLKSVEDAADRSAKNQAKANRDAARESEREWKRANAEMLRDFNRVQAQRKRDSDKDKRDEAKSARELARDYERANREILRDFQRMQAEKARAEKRAAFESRKAAAETRAAWKKFEKEDTGISTLTKSILGLAGAYASLKTVGSVVEFFNTYWENARKSIGEAVAGANEYGESLRELATLRDRLGSTTTETREQLVYRGRTLQGRSDAIAYQEGFLNTAQSGIKGKSITQEEADKLMVLGGQYQAAAGGSADTQGNLLGALPGIMASGGKGANTAESVFAKFGQVQKILSEGGSSASSGFSQLLGNSSYSKTGLYRDIAQQAAVQSAFSVSSPDSAGTRVDQFTRATVGGLNKMRGMGVEGGEKQNAYLKGIGATAQMDPVQIGRLISGDISKRQQEAKAAGSELNVYDYLAKHGYTDEDTRKALLEFHSSNTSGELQSFLDMANAPASADGLNQKMAVYRATSPLARSRAIDVGKDAAQFSNATGANEYFRSIREQAFTNLKLQNPDRYSGTFDEWDASGTANAWWRREIVNESERMIRDEAKRAGVEIPTGAGTYEGPDGKSFSLSQSPLNYSFMEGDFQESDRNQAQFYYQIGQKIAERRVGNSGGNPAMVGSPVPGMDQMLNFMERTAKATERNEQTVRNRLPQLKGPVAKPAAGNVGRN